MASSTASALTGPREALDLAERQAQAASKIRTRSRWSDPYVEQEPAATAGATALHAGSQCARQGVAAGVVAADLRGRGVADEDRAVGAQGHRPGIGGRRGGDGRGEGGIGTPAAVSGSGSPAPPFHHQHPRAVAGQRGRSARPAAKRPRRSSSGMRRSAPRPCRGRRRRASAPARCRAPRGASKLSAPGGSGQPGSTRRCPQSSASLTTWWSTASLKYRPHSQSSPSPSLNLERGQRHRWRHPGERRQAQLPTGRWGEAVQRHLGPGLARPAARRSRTRRGGSVVAVIRCRGCRAVCGRGGMSSGGGCPWPRGCRA